MIAVAKNVRPPAGTKAGEGVGVREAVLAFMPRALESGARFATWRTDSISTTSRSTF